MLLYTTNSDSTKVEKILELYSLSVKQVKTQSIDHLWGSNSLFHLMLKFNFYNEHLFDYLISKVSSNSFDARQSLSNITPNSRKKKIDYINNRMSCLRSHGILLQILKDHNKLKQDDPLKSLFIKDF